MTTTPADSSDLERTLEQLATDIRNGHRGLLHELRIEVVEGGVVLRGRAGTFYGKQVALHEVRRQCEIAVLANHITVG
jgi:hypothetical protein